MLINIPRIEVQEVHEIVITELGHIEKGCTSTLVGGYDSIAEGSIHKYQVLNYPSATGEAN